MWSCDLSQTSQLHWYKESISMMIKLHHILPEPCTEPGTHPKMCVHQLQLPTSQCAQHYHGSSHHCCRSRHRVSPTPNPGWLCTSMLPLSAELCTGHPHNSALLVSSVVCIDHLCICAITCIRYHHFSQELSPN